MVAVRNIWSCALEENLEALAGLISEGVSVNCQNSYGETALHIAGRHGLHEVAQVSQDCLRSVVVIFQSSK